MKDQGRDSNIHRLKSTAGHIDGIVRMLEANRSCIDVAAQIEAAQAALARVSESLLEAHLQLCMATALAGCDSQERERLLADLPEVVCVPQHGRSGR